MDTELYAVVGALCIQDLPLRVWVDLAAGGIVCFLAGACATWLWHRRRCRRGW